MSNVHEYLAVDELQTYSSIVQELLSKNTILIDTYPKKDEDEKLYQRVREFNESEAKFVFEGREPSHLSFPEEDMIEDAAEILIGFRNSRIKAL